MTLIIWFVKKGSDVAMVLDSSSKNCGLGIHYVMYMRKTEFLRIPLHGTCTMLSASVDSRFEVNSCDFCDKETNFQLLSTK